MLKLGLGTSLSSGTNFTPPAPNVISLDAPINSALNAKTYHAFGFDRMVEGYTGNSVRLKELTGNTESDFGFDSNGFFDVDAVHAWRSGADVNVVKFYDQTGNGGVMDNDGDVTFIVGNTVQRFGCHYDDATGLLTRSATDGAVGCDLAGVGAFKATGLSVSLSGNDLEIHMLNSMNTRKDIAGVDGNNAREYLFSYGTANNNYYNHSYYGTFGTFGRVLTSASGGESNVDNGTSMPVRKQYAQSITGGRLNNSKFLSTLADMEDNSKTLGSNNTAHINAGGLDDGNLVVGGFFSNSSGDIHSSYRGNFIFNGVVMTQALTDSERFMLQAKLGQVGQQHNLTSKTDIENIFDEIIYLKDVDPITGIVSGLNNKTSLNYNIIGSTYDFEHDDASGLRGINSPDQNAQNSFIASNTYFAGTTTGTILSLHRLTGPGSELMSSICQDTADGQGQSSAKSLALGFDHNNISLWARTATTRDEEGLTSSRYNSLGQTVGDKTTNQATGKYNRNTFHGDFTYNETFDGHTWTREAWANNDPTAPYTFDAPAGQHTAGNVRFPVKDKGMILQVATFEAPTGFNRTDSYAIRKPFLLQSKNKSYAGLIGSPIGQVVGDIAINNNAGVVDSEDNAKLMSDHFLGKWEGTLFAYAFLPNVILTKEQIEQIHINLYKLFE